MGEPENSWEKCLDNEVSIKYNAGQVALRSKIRMCFILGFCYS